MPWPLFCQDAAATDRPALPSQRKSIHINLSVSFEMVLLVCYHWWYVTAQSLSQNMIDAYMMQQMPCIVVVAIFGSLHLHITVSNDYGPDNFAEDSVVRQ